jgi:arylsulfatase A-like enzyme
VLFLADDLGYGELGCYGNRAAITPNLDRFAAEGLRLTDCHSASSVCSPSRSALLTGRMPYRNGVFTWIPEKSPIHLRTSEVALPKLLRNAGYDTCHVGKWHLNGLFNSPEQPQPNDHGYAWWLATQNNAAFGMVMRAIDELGAAANTLVFFTSDNGPEGNGDKGPGRGLAGGLRARKRSMYEGGHRVPGLVRWPGKLQPGTESDLVVIGSDFFPTVLAAAGLESPAGVTLDGVNLLPALGGGAVARTEPLYWRWGGKVAYREGDWKIVADEKLTTVELYDLAADLGEATDLAEREATRLAGMLERLRAHTAELEAEGPDWWKAEGFNGRRKPPQARPGE